MSASNALETLILALLFKNSNGANIGDATGLRGSSTAGSLYIGLHTADPGEAGDQTTNEAAYTNYARIAVARSGAAWTVTNDTVVNIDAITFPVPGASGLVDITHFSIGTALSGAGILLMSAALTGGAFTPTNGGTAPNFAAGALQATVA